MANFNNILVVDDDDAMCDILSNFLGKEGYNVTTAASGEEMRQAIAVNDPDLILLDLGLPDTDGLSLVREIRSRRATPIIMITGKSDPMEKVVGLEIGADDYVTKPFNLRELLARIRSVMRRVTEVPAQAFTATPTQVPTLEGASEASCAYFSGWQLDMRVHELTSPTGEEVHLTNHEFQLLSIFIKNANKTMSRTQLMNQITGKERDYDDRSIDVHVSSLRKKIESESNRPKLIKTIRSVGYLFTGAVEFR